MQENHRSLSYEAAGSLRPGDEHYRSYVGPPGQFDVMGSAQFRLLATLGLRERHKVLDVGCGALRLGQLLIPFLAPGHYFGLDPNQWLVEDALEGQLGQDIVRVKKPQFFSHDDFSLSTCGDDFDFIVAQSILSHTGADLAQTILDEIAKCLAVDALALVTFVDHNASMESGYSSSGWIYPQCVTFDPDEVETLATRAGLAQRPIPWFHPRQTWHVLARSPEMLPDPRFDYLLHGAVLRSEELQASVPASDP